MESYGDIYREEAYELLTELESSLLELEKNPSDMDLAGRVFRAMHTIKGAGVMFGFDDIAAFTHNIETVYDLVMEKKIRVTNELISLTLSAADRIKKMVDGNELNNVDMDAITRSFKAMIPVENEQEDEIPEETVEEKKNIEEISSVRVASEKLDILVNLVGELVTVQAQLSEYIANHDCTDLQRISEEVERLTGELRDNTMDIRMMPIGTTFNKFKRLVRDLSRDLGKNVELHTAGGETELDKTVIDKLNDPITHIIRNCIDHGIESPEVRAQAGKKPAGRIHLSAVHSGGNVLIRISDDGAGLNVDAIRRKAQAKGLIAPDADLTDRDIHSLIFEPGFSTAESVTGVSGRGVGMDVVKRSIDNLRGTIFIESAEGDGTIITLKLPLTLAIIDGLLVKIGGDFYVIPLSAVEECVKIPRHTADKASERQMMTYREKVIPYLSVRELLNVKTAPPDIESVVITEVNGETIGLGVDDLVGQYQAVIKNISKLYRDVAGISGATILGDGTVALIIDVPDLVKLELESIVKKEEENE